MNSFLRTLVCPKFFRGSEWINSVKRYGLPYSQVRPPKIFQFFQIFPAFSDFSKIWKLCSVERTPDGQKSCFFLQCRVLWLVIQQKQKLRMENFSSLCQNLGAPLCRFQFVWLENFSSCHVFQLFPAFLQLLRHCRSLFASCFVAAGASSCYSRQTERPNLEAAARAGW